MAVFCVLFMGQVFEYSCAMNEKIYTCSTCKYTFGRKMRPLTCPDCGSDTVRDATEAEREEYRQNQREFYPERYVS